MAPIPGAPFAGTPDGARRMPIAGDRHFFHFSAATLNGDSIGYIATYSQEWREKSIESAAFAALLKSQQSFMEITGRWRYMFFHCTPIISQANAGGDFIQDLLEIFAAYDIGAPRWRDAA